MGIRRRRRWTVALTLIVGAFGVLFLVPAAPAAAVDFPGIPSSDDFDCKDAPPAVKPDSGLGGWFLNEPKKAPEGDPFEAKPTVSIYDVYGYGGLTFETYDLGCGGSARDPVASAMTGTADLMMAPAMFLVGLDNSVREYAYKPNSMWGWTNDFVQRASDALRERVFTLWGAVVVGIVGIWLLWGARGGNLSQAAVTAGWAIMVMALVTAVASWPVKASTMADNTLTGALGQISSGMSRNDPGDNREPAVRASGVLTETVLYDQWLRGTLGSSDSDTARKYGPKLYEARAISWADAKKMSKSDKDRKEILEAKAKLWTDTAAEIQEKDPDAYEYLKGKRGSQRVGAAILATISAIVVTPFDLMASLLILIAFLIIRLAVAFLPAIGTIGILKPAAGPLRGLLRTVLAAFINCVIFGAGSAVFLLAVEVISGTNSLAGWQQVLLIWLTGLILWLLLRPYRRLTQLTGMDPFGEMAGGLGRMHRRVFGDLKQLAIVGAGSYAGDLQALESHEKKKLARAERPENWSRKARRQAVRPLATQQRVAEAMPGPFGGAARRQSTQYAQRDERTAAMAPNRMVRPESGSRAAAHPPPPAESGRPPLTRGRTPERLGDSYEVPPSSNAAGPDNTAVAPEYEPHVIYRPGRGYIDSRANSPR